MNLDNWPDMTLAERDALVAEHVMGWHRVQKLKRNGGFPYWADEADQIRSQCQDWFPATDISAAMEVLDTFGKGWEIFISRGDCYDSGPQWEITLRKGQLTQGQGEAPTLPEAICLAALNAKETGK